MSEEGSVTSQCTGQQQRENLSSFSACCNYRCPACHTTRCPDCTAAGWAQAHLWERVGFMELMEFMGGCMGSFPGGSFCRLFWWRSSKSRPSSSHHDDSSAVQTEQMTVSTHLRNQHSPVQVQDTLTGVTSQTDKHQECKVCPWTTTHTIILSNSLWLPYTSIRTFLPKLQTFCISQEAEENLSEQYRDEEWMKQKDMG